MHEVLESIKNFINKLRNGELLSLRGKKIKNLVIIGIGGSYLSIEFVYEALRSHE